MNSAHMLFDRCMQQPTKPAIIFEDTIWTYGALKDQARRAALVFQHRGAVAGARIALLLPNIPEFAVAYFGAQLLGAVVVSINVMLKCNELRYILHDCQPTIIVATAELAANLPADHGAASVLLVDDPASWAEPLAATDPPADLRPLPRQSADPAAIVYTSGTTGFPKGAVLSHGNLGFNARAKQRYCAISATDRLLLFVPLFHCFGQNAVLISGLNAEATIVLLRRFQLADVLAAIAQHQATMLFGVPAIFVTMIQANITAAQLASVRYFFSAASILPETVARQWYERYGRVIHEGYGLTETSPFASYNHVDAYKFGSIGMPVAGVSIQIVDAALQPVAPGERGEIVIKGPNVMLGYWDELSGPSSAIKNGWFHSGDIGIIDAEGYLYIVDRLKDMINVSGFKVYPSDVERVIRMHAAVSDVAVYGLDDPIKSEIVLADIIINPDSQVSSADLRTFCGRYLAAYKVPAQINIVTEIPRSPAGKVLKQVLRKRARQASC